MSSNFAKFALVAGAIAIGGPALAGAVGTAGAAGAAGAGAAAGGAALPTLAATPFGLVKAGGAAASSGIFGTGISGTQLLGIGGSLTQGLGQYSQAQSQADEYALNARLREIDAVTSRQNARAARLAAKDRADMARRETRRRVAAMQTKFTKAGVVTSEGSPLLAITEQYQEGELEANRFLYQGRLDAEADVFSSKVSEMQAEAFRSRAKDTRTSGAIKAGTTVLTGVSQLLG